MDSKIPTAPEPNRGQVALRRIRRLIMKKIKEQDSNSEELRDIAIQSVIVTIIAALVAVVIIAAMISGVKEATYGM